MIWQQGHSPHSTPHATSESCSHINATQTTSTSPFYSSAEVSPSSSSSGVFLEACKVLFPLCTSFKTFEYISRFQYKLYSPSNILQKGAFKVVCNETFDLILYIHTTGFILPHWLFSCLWKIGLNLHNYNMKLKSFFSVYCVCKAGIEGDCFSAPSLTCEHMQLSKGGIPHWSTIRARHQSNPGLKDFLFPSGILISLTNKLMTVSAAPFKGLFFQSWNGISTTAKGKGLFSQWLLL